uniref:Beta-defensin-like domain-containing protein n=1 Tax=Buteo japonicus TaxID=224669 RepID=A0A8C0BMU0_9AVES
MNVLYVSLHIETGHSSQCRRRGGHCSSVGCRYPLRAVGICSGSRICCKR